MLSRLRKPLLATLSFVVAVATLLLLGPVLSLAEGDRGGFGTYRTYWGVLGPLRVTTRVESFGVDEVTRYREWDWNAMTLAITLGVLAVMWGLFWLIVRWLRRRAKPQA